MKTVMLILVSLFAAACSGESEQREDTVGKEIADDYNRQMQRAREVEVRLQESVDRVEDALQQSDRQPPE